MRQWKKCWTKCKATDQCQWNGGASERFGKERKGKTWNGDKYEKRISRAGHGDQEREVTCVNTEKEGTRE